MSIQNSTMPAPPQTLVQLFRLMLKGMFKGLLIRLPLALGAGLFVWVLHTFLLVGPNEGFALGPYKILHSILALRDRIFAGTLFWTLLAMFGSMVIFSFFRGPAKLFKNIISTPAWIGHSLRRTGNIGPALLFGVGALSVVAGTMIGNRLISLLLSLILLGSLVAQQGSFFVVFLSLAWSDAQRLLQSSKPPHQFEPYWVGAGLTGVTLGFFSAAILPFAPFCGCASAFLLFSAMVAWIFYKKGIATTGLAVFLLAVGIGLMLPLTTALADDGGWVESGGSLISWLTSEGAIIAIALGLPPSLGAALGVLLGSSISMLIPPSLTDDFINQELTAIQMQNLHNRVAEIIKQRIKEGYFVRNPGLFRKAWNNTLGRIVEWAGGWKGGQCGEFGEWGQQWSKEAVQEIFGNGVVITDITAYRNYFVNHNATRIITPNGDRLVIDYWEGVQTGQPKIYTEQEWINKWKKELGGTPDFLRQTSTEEFTFNKMINDYGEEKGIEIFRRTHKNQPDKAEAIIRSYKKDPWPTQETKPPTPVSNQPSPKPYQPPASPSDMLHDQIRSDMPSPKK